MKSPEKSTIKHAEKCKGDLKGARRLYERALAIREKALGPEHPRTGLKNLARLLQDQGDLVAARPLYERALAITEKMLGPEHPDTNRLRGGAPRSPLTGMGGLTRIVKQPAPCTGQHGVLRSSESVATARGVV